MSPLDLMEVAAAGGAGAASRWLVDRRVTRLARSGLPLGTLTVNLSGSLLLGVLAGLTEFHGAPPRVALVAGAGFCGGYTTFSTAVLESFTLLGDDRRRDGVLVAVLNALGCVAAAAGGLALASL